MGPSQIRPLTQFDILRLAKAKSSPRSMPLESDTTVKSDRKRERSAEGDSAGTVSVKARHRGVLETGVAVEGGLLSLRTVDGSPWGSYTKEYNLDLGGPVVVSLRKASPVKLVHVRAFPTSIAEKTLHMFHRTQHNKIVTPIEAFTTDDSLYIVLENMPVSLEQIVRCPAYPDEQQLRAILGQILEGMAFLASAGLKHKSLSCSNILLNTEGNVKIAHQESCDVVSKSQSGPRDVGVLSLIMMELMQKYVKEDGAVGIDDTRRWPPNSDAVTFLSATTSATSAVELLEARYSSAF